ncbi:hypothetical protein [Helicobacter ganmani]|uniref:hypothetical protein n=1 Tax=Helicobacter ganmani TaxID=60246 RepID=UPI003A8808A5
MKTILNFFVKKLCILSKESFIFKKPCEIPHEKLQNVSNVQKYYGISLIKFVNLVMKSGKCFNFSSLQAQAK